MLGSEDSLAAFEKRIANILPWLHEASNPYWDWFWGSAKEGRTQLNTWLHRESSELSEKNVVCLSEENCIIGGYIAFPGGELQTYRKADLLTVANYARTHPHENVIARMRQARSVFAAVADTEFYLSRMGVASRSRGRGVGSRLMEMFLQQGRARGFKQFRLDVCAENHVAIRLYRTAGFVVADESTVCETNIRYCSMVAPI